MAFVLSNKKMFLLVALVLVLSAALTPSHAAEASACRVALTTSFEPPLSGTTAGAGALRIGGTLSECAPGAPAASVSAGNVWTDPATGFTWQEPVGSIEGTCINNTTSATTITRWSDGAISITDYSSDSLTYGISISGTNVASVTLAAVDKQAGQADTLTINATRGVGATMAGLLVADDLDDPVGSAEAAFNACAGAGLHSTLLNGVEVFAG